RRGLLDERRVVRRSLRDFRRAEVVRRVVKFFVRRELYDGRALADERRVVVLAYELQPRELARDVEHAAQLRDVDERDEEYAVQHDRERQETRHERPARRAIYLESVEKLCHMRPAPARHTDARSSEELDA